MGIRIGIWEYIFLIKPIFSKGCMIIGNVIICETWLFHMRDITHSYVWHDSFTCVTWPIYMCDRTHSYVWHDHCICVINSYLNALGLHWKRDHMCDVTHSYVWHDSFICVTWLFHMCDMTHLCVRHVSLICATWLIHMWHDPFTWVIHEYMNALKLHWQHDHTCDMTLSHAWHDSLICVTWRHATHVHESRHTYTQIWGGYD